MTITAMHAKPTAWCPDWCSTVPATASHEEWGISVSNALPQLCHDAPSFTSGGVRDVGVYGGGTSFLGNPHVACDVTIETAGALTTNSPAELREVAASILAAAEWLEQASQP